MTKHHGVNVIARKWYGNRTDTKDARDFTFMPEGVSDLPTLVDLRADCPPVMDQGQLGSCTAHGIIGALRYLLVRKGGPRDHRLSRLQLYYDERVVEGSVSEDSGAEIRDGIKCAAKIGVAHETMWPYVISKFARRPTDRVYQDAIKFEALKYERVTVDPAHVKAALASGYPVIVGFSVYESFEDDVVASTGMVPQPDLAHEQMIGGHCFIGSTEIPLLNGTTKTIEEISRTGGPNWVYSIQNGRIVPGLMTHAWKSGTNRECVKVTLDDGTSFVCTHDHRIMLRNGKYKKASKLTSGVSLMPLYRGLSKHGYETIYDPVSNSVKLTHRHIASANGRYKGVIHHVDFDKRNNEPTNLQSMSWDEHTALHAQHTDLLNDYARSDPGRKRSKELMHALWNDPEWSGAQREKLRKRCRSDEMKLLASKTLKQYQRDLKTGVKQLTDKQRRARKLNMEKIANDPNIQWKGVISRKDRLASDPEFAEQTRLRAIKNLQGYNTKLKAGEVQISEKQRSARRENARRLNAKLLNHKVISVEPAGQFDVYDAEVEQHHNFAIGVGVFVHNCVYAVGYGQHPGTITCRNSWGAWGDNGDCYLPEQYICSTQFASDFWIVTAAGLATA